MQGAQERREQGRDSKRPPAFFFFFDLPSTSTAHFFPPLPFLSLSLFLPRFPTKRNSRRGGQAPEDASREACQEGRRRRGRRGYEMREKKRERGVSKNLTAPKKKLVKLPHPSFMKQKQPHPTVSNDRFFNNSNKNKNKNRNKTHIETKTNTTNGCQR